MTTPNHLAAIWQHGGADAGTIGYGSAANIGRKKPPDLGFTDIGGVLRADDTGPISILPYAFLWPTARASADVAGVAFPAGLIAVAIRAYLPSHAVGPPTPPFGPPVVRDYTGDLNDGLETYWTTSGTNAFMVPASLPVGYTANLQTAFRSLDPLTYYDAYFTASNIVRPTWLPQVGCGVFGDDATKAIGDSGVTRTGPDGSGNFKWWMVVHAGVGLRKFQYRMNAAGGAWTVRVSHNADGHAFNPASPTEGDTADFSSSGGSGTSAWIDAGALTPTLGTVTSYQVSIESASAWTSIGLRSSCRVDVPLPYTVPGLGDLVAPGGYVP